MPTYVLPQVLVFQDFQLVPAIVANPLRSYITGGHAQLVRFDDLDERPSGRLDYYDSLLEECFEWPNRDAGAQINPDDTKVFITDAILKYFEDTTASGSIISKVSGYNNRVTSDTVNFVENTVTYPRDAVLLDRDVQLGDVAKVRAIVGPDTFTTWANVIDFVAEEVAAVIQAATTDANNDATQIASTAVVKTAGADNCITLTPDGSAYDGLLDGDISEVYTVIVEESSAGSDLTVAKLRILSASGNDDVAVAVPEDAGTPTDIGTRGLTVVFDFDATSTCSSDANDDAVEPDDLVAGQTWEVTVAQAFTAPTPTSAGTYTGTNDTTYIIEVTKGGLYTSEPEISVSTTNAIDLSGPTKVTAAATPVVVGTKGVTVEFDGAGLSRGDKYYITALSVSDGAIRTIVLDRNLSTDVPGGTELDLTLYIRKPELEIPENREGFAPLVNWEQSETEICLKSAIIAYDATWTDGGVPQPLPVLSEDSQDYGLAYVEYRAWKSNLCFEVGTIDDVGQLDDLIPGPLVPENILKWGVFKALSNSNGVEVKFAAVCNPNDTSDWIQVLDLVSDRDDVYGFVPLTKERLILDLFQAHVDAKSSPEEGLWRVAWFNLEGVPIKDLVTAEINDGTEVLAVIEDDAATSGTQFTIVRVPAGDGDFITRGVRPGDIVRTLFVSDGFGEFTWSEFTVDEVQNEDQIRLQAGPSGPVTVAAKIEVIRNLSPTEEALEIAQNSGVWANRRIRSVWPDVIETSGTIQDGYHLCAALAGLSSGVVPHQGLTRLEISGFTDVPRTIQKFNKFQLDTMAFAGTWIVTQDYFTGQIFTRHAVTTADNADIAKREEMVTRNVDSVSFRFKDTFEPFIGISNVTPSMESLIRSTTNSLIEVLKGEGFLPRLGGQLIEGTIIELRPHAFLLDRYVLTVDLDVPFPLNNIEIHLVV